MIESSQPLFRLPSSVITKIDLSRLIRELEQLDNDMTTAISRTKVGAESAWQPVLSEQLTECISLNQLKLGEPSQRRNIIAELRSLKDAAPIVHMTFASPADQESLGKLAEWVRTKVHPQAIITVGLQPDLIGGVYVRTPNHVHDLSVRAQLAGHHDLIIQEVEALSGGR